MTHSTWKKKHKGGGGGGGGEGGFAFSKKIDESHRIKIQTLIEDFRASDALGSLSLFKTLICFLFLHPFMFVFIMLFVEFILLKQLPLYA